MGLKIGRFVNGKPKSIPGHNILHVFLGTLVLVIGWYGFNVDSSTALGRARKLYSKVSFSRLRSILFCVL